MGSKPSKQSGGSKGGGMSPGQSMAMAGNTGLASITEADANKLQKAIRNVNQATGGGRGSSFRDIGQQIGEVGSKYGRPAGAANFVKDMSAISDAINKGATIFQTPDGIQRVNFVGTGIKDDQGRTILSKQIPNLNATAPSLGQAGGDIARAVTGFNSLQYTDPSSNVPQMVRTQGLADVLAKAAIPGSTAFRIIQDLYGKGKGFLFPGEEEEEEDIFSSGADATGGAAILSANMKDTPKVGDEIDEFIRTIGDPYVDPYSSGADATRPAVANLNDIFSSGADAVDIGTNIPDRTRFDQVAEPLLELPDFLTGSSGEDKPKILQIRDTTGGGGNQEDGNQNQQPQDPPPNTDPSAQELAIRKNLELAGFTQQQIDSIVDGLGFQMGGLVPPEKGPMSQGVGSLFQER
mgnify:CR=1 FL=1